MTDIAELRRAISQRRGALNRQVGQAVVKAELNSASTSAQLVSAEFHQPFEYRLQAEGYYRLDLCVDPGRNDTRVRFPDHWLNGRFETAGQLFLVPPGQEIHIRNSVGAVRALVCHFSVPQLHEALDAPLEWSDRHLEASFDVSSPHIRRLLLQLIEEVRHPGLASDIMCEAIAMQIGIEIYRFHHGIEEERPVQGLAPWRLRRIGERLQDGDRPPTIAELAAICGLSQRHLSRAFQASRGVSLGRYLAERRTEDAKTMLDGGASVKAVAHAMGYSGPAPFCHAFRRSLGMSPGQFKLRGKA